MWVFYPTGLSVDTLAYTAIIVAIPHSRLSVNFKYDYDTHDGYFNFFTNLTEKRKVRIKTSVSILWILRPTVMYLPYSFGYES